MQVINTERERERERERCCGYELSCQEEFMAIISLSIHFLGKMN